MFISLYDLIIAGYITKWSLHKRHLVMFRLHTISITLQTNTGYYDPELSKNDRDENGDRNVPAFLVSYSIGKPFSIV